MNEFPTPPNLTNRDEELWADYIARAIGFLLENVERTETRGLSLGAQFEIPDGSILVRAYFCLGCDSLHIESSVFDTQGDEVGDTLSIDPATIRDELRRLARAS